MKESKIKDQFEEIASKLRTDSANWLLRANLRGIQNAVQGLQDAGMDASLTVRPGDCECPIAKEGSSPVLANGTVCLDGLDIDFMLQRYENGANLLQAAVGKYSVAYTYLSSDSDVKALFTNVLLKTKAEFSVVEEFNVHASGNIATTKNLSVSPPLKLKKPEQP